MLVKALRGHGNSYGQKYKKAEGDEYEVTPEVGASLVAQGLVVAGSADKALEDLKRPDLVEIAEREGVPVGRRDTMPVIIDNIRAKRAEAEQVEQPE